jgi:hypothetical protein
MGLFLIRSSICEAKVKAAPKARHSADAVPFQSPLLTSSRVRFDPERLNNWEKKKANER